MFLMALLFLKWICTVVFTKLGSTVHFLGTIFSCGLKHIRNTLYVKDLFIYSFFF